MTSFNREDHAVFSPQLIYKISHTVVHPVARCFAGSQLLPTSSQIQPQLLRKIGNSRQSAKHSLLRQSDELTFFAMQQSTMCVSTQEKTYLNRMQNQWQDDSSWYCTRESTLYRTVLPTRHVNLPHIVRPNQCWLSSI